jgi:hypothetical protein
MTSSTRENLCNDGNYNDHAGKTYKNHKLVETVVRSKSGLGRAALPTMRRGDKGRDYFTISRFRRTSSTKAIPLPFEHSDRFYTQTYLQNGAGCS